MARGLLIAVLFVGIFFFVPREVAPASAQVETWVTFSGWIVAVGSDYVDARLRGYPMGSPDVLRFAFTSATRFETALVEGAGVVVVAWRQDGRWYAASISAEPEEGNEMIRR